MAANLRQLADQKGLRFELAVPPEPIVLQTDRRALSQIIINLTNNAIKFTERGEVRVDLALEPAMTDERAMNAVVDGQASVVVRVSDTGIGIRVADQADLFEAFTQVRPADARAREGTGLGLHLSQRLAELLQLDPGTVARGRKQLLEQEVEWERVRKPGAGRKPVEKKRPR